MPPGQVHATIAERIGMSRGTVRNWFQNQRAKIRRRRIENAVAMANSGGKGFPGDDLPDSEVGSNVGSNIGSDVGTIIGSSMGSIIGSNVGSIVGSYAGASAIVQSDTTVGTYLDRNGMPSAEFKPWRGDYFMSNSSTMPGRSFSDYPELAGTPATANGKRLQVLAPYQLPAPQYELRFEPYQNDSAVAGQPHNRHHFFESDIKHPLPQRPNNGRPFVMSIEALV
ncbi:hypothetical protein HDU84_001071 [Entophlyctis sp. JEL0112]|nr:hypothetical protein HDU84_001071 [Entophlyctis sp. JEL0112]